MNCYNDWKVTLSGCLGRSLKPLKFKNSHFRDTQHFQCPSSIGTQSKKKMKFEKEEKTQQRSNEGLCLKWAKTLFPFFCVSFSVCPFYIFVTISVLCLSFSPFMDFCSSLSPSLFVILFSYFSLFPFSVSPFHFLCFSVLFSISNNETHHQWI